MEGRKILTILLFVILVGGGAYLLAGTEPRMALVMTVCVCGAVVALLRTEMAIYFLVVAMLLSPQFSVGKTLLATRDRPVTLRLDDFLIVIISVTWFIKNAFYKELNLIRSTPLNGAIWIYSLSCVLSTLVGVLTGNVEIRSGALFVLKYIEYFVIFWLVINATHDEQQVRRYLAVMLAVALIVSIVAIMQIPSGQRVSAPFEGEKGEPNTLGGYLLFALSLLMGLIFCTAQYRKTLILLSGVIFIPFLFSLSRGSYLGFLLVVFLFPWLVRRKMLMLWVLFAVLVIVAFPKVLPRPVLDRVDYTFNQAPQKAQVVLLGKRLDTSTSERYWAFAVALDAFIEKPLIGWGVTGWRFLDTMYFRTLVETGLLGMVSFLYLIYRIIQMAARTRKYFLGKNPFYFGLSSGFIAGTVGLLVHAIAANTFIVVRIMEPYWMLCAIIFILPEIESQSTVAAPDLASVA